MKNNLFIIAQSGWSYVGSSFIAFLLFGLIGWGFMALLAFGMMLLFAYLFRNPERESLHFEPHAIVSPVDGEVISINELDAEGEYAYRVDVLSGYKDLAILRSPIDAKHLDIESTKGARLSMNSPRFEALSEFSELVFEGEFVKVKVIHRLTQSFAPLTLDVSKDEKIYQGMRYGVMQCGVTSIYFPANVRLDLQLHQQLVASHSLLGFVS